MRRIGFAAAAGAALTVSLGGAFTGALAGPASAGTGVGGATRVQTRPATGVRPAAPARPAAAGQPGQGLRVTIGSVSPDIGRPGKAITVTGRVTNDGHGPAQGLTTYLRSSAGGLQYRGQLDQYATGSYTGDQQVSPAVDLPDLAPGRSAGFRLSFRPGDAGIRQFGVYPLAAEVDEANGSAATARTFLPFWPGSQPGLQKLKVAWVWPLIDQPRQGACPALLDNTLASSLDAARGGRLGGLLQAGTSYGREARITWAVDPALLADVDAMTRPYHVLDGPRCGDRQDAPASGVARQWLASLSSTLSGGRGGQPVFVTPYADVDAAALTHAGLDTDLANAFAAGRAAATSVLGQKLDVAGGGTLDGTTWPPGGLADSSVLDNLAVNGVRTAVLDGNEMPPADQTSYTPDAVTQVPSGVGSDVRVLLADDTLTSVLGGSGAAAGSTPAQTEQWFLAETAMIVAEAPGLGRSAVIAPPRRWSPSAALAAGLLSETASAPWLQPEHLDSLTAAAAPASVTRTPLPPSQMSPAELGSGYLAAIKPIDTGIRRFNSILSRPEPLPRAVARAESSAWRGKGQDAGRDLTSQVGRYAANQEAKVRIVNSPGVTLSGARGNVPVSIINQLPRGYTATVKLEAAAAATRAVPAAGRLTIGNGTGRYIQTVTISAGESMTVRLPVHARSPGVTEVELRLLTPDGAPLPGRPTVLKVQSTPLGLVAEVITGVAVGVMVLTSIVRVVRRGLREGRPAPPRHPQGGAALGEPEGRGAAGEGTADAAQAGDLHAGAAGEGTAEAAQARETAQARGLPSAAGGQGSTDGMPGEALAPRDACDQDGFSSGHGAGQEAGTVVTEDGRPASQHAPHYPEGPDEFADARPRAWPDTP